MDQDYRCRFCRRYVIDGLYVQVSFPPDGVSNVCDNCMEKRDEGWDAHSEEFAVWQDTEVEVAP